VAIALDTRMAEQSLARMAVKGQRFLSSYSL
jgi:hypothetical protein